MALNKKNTYTDYKIQSKPRFKSGVAVIDNAVEKGAQSRNTKRQNKAASPDAQKEALKAFQRKLADAGYYKGKIDGIWGKQSKAAQAAYDKANGKRGETIAESISRRKQNLINKAKEIESKETDTQQGNFPGSFESDNKQVGEAIAKLFGSWFPAARQVLKFKTRSDSGTTETNKDFSNSYLENLSQLGQVAYRQHVRKHGYPKSGESISLSLTPSVYKEINPSGKYADFTDLLGITNAFLGGDRQVEYTDGGMSGTATIDKDGNVHWNVTDASSWAFDPGQEERLRKAIDDNWFDLGSRVRYQMGILDKNNEKDNYSPIKQNLTVTFPADTISGIARYSTVPKYKQKR